MTNTPLTGKEKKNKYPARFVFAPHYEIGPNRDRDYGIFLSRGCMGMNIFTGKHIIHLGIGKYVRAGHVDLNTFKKYL